MQARGRGAEMIHRGLGARWGFLVGFMGEKCRFRLVRDGMGRFGGGVGVGRVESRTRHGIATFASGF